MPDNQDFLTGGGEMGERMRALDWSTTPLGAAADWPQNLKTCVRIVLTSRQPMFVWWGDALVNLYNDAYKSIVGGKHPTALGQPAHVVWREIWDQVGPRAEQTMRGNEGTYDEALLLIMERNGYPEETYYTFSYSPVPNDRGGTGGIICANTDDTRRIIGERQLALLRELAGRMAEARRIEDAVSRGATSLETDPRDLSFALIYLVEPEKRRGVLAATAGIPRGHRAAPEIVPLDGLAAWPVGEVARGHQVLVVDDLASRFGELPRGAWPVPPSRAVVLPIAASGSNGKAGVLVVGLSPYRLFDEDYRGFLRLVAGQISASIGNAQAYEEEKNRVEALAELDRAKTTFFSNVSHEFRTPLTLMIGPIEDALASEPRAVSGENLKTLHRNSLRLLKLVNTLLDFARIEAGRATATYRATDLAALTVDLASAFRSTVERAGLDYSVDCSPLPEPVFVDHDMWEKIVLNLISNAVKFTFDGSIQIALRWAGDHAELLVRDSGIGIPAGEIPHLFERFHRVQGARARTHEGSGIGLALVHELVKMHGGSIRLDSRVGQGTTFAVAIPRGRDHLPSERVDEQPTTAASTTGAAAYVQEALGWLPGAAAPDEQVPAGVWLAGPAPDRVMVAEGARVLLADDNADMREYVARLLRPHWSVEVVTDGAAALAAVRARVPDLVLTDVMMPGLDGFGLLRALREDPATRPVPVIMLSARAGAESRVDGLEAGADDYLVKPFSARELVARVATHLQIAQLRRRAEQERQRLHDVLMQAPVAMAVVSGPELRYELANPAYCDMVRRTDLGGRKRQDVFPELVEDPTFPLLEKVAASGEPLHAHEAKVRLVRDGVQKDAYFDIALAPVGEIDGSKSVVVVALEVTEHVHARKRIEALRAAAEEASRTKDNFLSTLSHELRTPLNAIVGWSSVLRAGNVRPEQMAKVVETIDRNARVQVRLIEDLLELSSIEQGKLVLNVGPVEMRRVVEAAIDAVRPAADAKGVRVQPFLDSRASIVGDPDRLQQVVWNLLTNAIKFTPRAGCVQVRLRRDHSLVELVVSDTGQGIDPDFLPHVFDRFRQADPSYTRSAGGLGLGLAIVRSLVELHGGIVTASSAGPGKGASFLVQLPTAPLRADVTSPAAGSSSSDEVQPRTFECPPELRGLRVLVVDDEPETRSLIEYVLEQCEARVTAVGSAREALALIEASPFDALLSDVAMPEEDGHSLIRKVRLLPELRGGRVPAIALTAYARKEDRTAVFKAGFDVHLAKPIDPGELLVILARLVSRQLRESGRADELG
jgi:signal transduction histidine kinase/DNA-binding response OmpR family regulator